MPKREHDAAQPTVKLSAAADGGAVVHNTALPRDKRLMANSQSPLWHRYTESRLRQFVTRQ
jgi:hypothetical protein